MLELHQELIFAELPAELPARNQEVRFSPTPHASACHGSLD